MALPLRAPLALVAGTLTGALGAGILGEYELAGPLSAIAGALLGVTVAEVTLATAGRALLHPLPAGQGADRPARAPIATVLFVAAVAWAGTGMVWAIWIASNRFRNPIPPVTWLGPVAAAAAAAWWFRTGRRRAPRNRPASER